jgi:DNA-binding PadR family transcriptional regulator
MSPVFRHGRLRLYLLKLLDESPRHGYEVIRLLQDRFMGVYAPSPGTIYPRLARLEEEGLVTHDEADGKKVYRITEKGREELRNRSADLSDLEAEISASVRDIAREVTEDVRETVRNLREELTWAARDMQRRGGPAPGHQDSRPGRDEAWRAREAGRQERAAARRARARARYERGPGSRGDSWAAAADDPADRLGAEQDRLDQQQDRLNAEQTRLDEERTRLATEQARVAAEQARLDEAQHQPGAPDEGAAAERLEAEQDRLGEEQDRLGEQQDRLDEQQDQLDEEQDRLNEERGEPDEGQRGDWAHHGPGQGSQRRGGPGRGGRGRGNWDWQSWADWPGRRGWPHGGPPWADPGALPDLEQLARHFTRELRDAAAHAQAVSEEAATDLRVILDDALARIKAEVFGGKTSGPGDAPPPDEDN